MGTGILISLIIACIIILTLLLIVLYVRRPQQNRMKNDTFSLDAISYSPIFKKLIDVIVPPAEEREYRKNERLISDSGYNLNMREFYLLKVIVPVVLLVVFLSIYFINRQVYVDAIITDSLTKTVDVLGSSNVNENATTSSEKRKIERAKKDTYDIVDNFVDSRLLKNATAIEAKQMIQEALIRNNLATESSIYYETEEMYNKMLRVEAAKKVEPVKILLIFLVSLAGFTLPNLFLVLARMVRYQSFDNEVLFGKKNINQLLEKLI